MILPLRQLEKPVEHFLRVLPHSVMEHRIRDELFDALHLCCRFLREFEVDVHVVEVPLETKHGSTDEIERREIKANTYDTAVTLTSLRASCSSS